MIEIVVLNRQKVNVGIILLRQTDRETLRALMKLKLIVKGINAWILSPTSVFSQNADRHIWSAGFDMFGSVRSHNPDDYTCSYEMTIQCRY